jgi:hypothetical protein
MPYQVLTYEPTVLKILKQNRISTQKDIDSFFAGPSVVVTYMILLKWPKQMVLGLRVFCFGYDEQGGSMIWK